MENKKVTTKKSVEQLFRESLKEQSDAIRRAYAKHESAQMEVAARVAFTAVKLFPQDGKKAGISAWLEELGFEKSAGFGLVKFGKLFFNLDKKSIDSGNYFKEGLPEWVKNCGFTVLLEVKRLLPADASESAVYAQLGDFTEWTTEKALVPAGKSLSDLTVKAIKDLVRKYNHKDDPEAIEVAAEDKTEVVESTEQTEKTGLADPVTQAQAFIAACVDKNGSYEFTVDGKSYVVTAK